MIPDRELNELSFFLRGHKFAKPPIWAIILDAAGGDPLRAQKIEENITGYWWSRYLAYRQEQSRVAREHEIRINRIGNRKT